MNYDSVELQRRALLADKLHHPALPATRLDVRSLRLDGLQPQPLPAVQGLRAAPQAEVLIVVNGGAAAAALADLFTPKWPLPQWHPYVEQFDSYLHELGERSAARASRSLGRYLLAGVGKARVLCFASELQLHADAKDDWPTLPLKQLLKQLIADCQPQLVLSSGNAAAVYPDMVPGDVVISHAAKFACRFRFAQAPFNHQTYKSSWKLSGKCLGSGEQLMRSLASKLVGPPPPRGDCRCGDNHKFNAMIHQDGVGMPDFHPVLTADYFEFGSDAGELQLHGAALALDDAVLALACSELPEPPLWASVRSISVPLLNGHLPVEQQEDCAMFYQQNYGYWAAVNSSLACWAIIGGML